MPAPNTVPGDESSQWVSISQLPAGHGLQLQDAIERRHVDLPTETPVTPTPVDPDTLSYPVAVAATITTTGLTLPGDAAYLRSASGEYSRIHPFQSYSTGDGAHTLELSTAVKLYLRIEGEITITADPDNIWLSSDEPRRIVIAARSYHERPVGTITTTSDPYDIMAAISHFGSALKTTAPTRSYPTLRGHPPAIELGDTLHIPDGLTRPETRIELRVPPQLDRIYPVAPLAYYLGAEVTPGKTPTLRTADGFEYELLTARSYEVEIQRLLRQVFYLDCLTRSHPNYKGRVAEYYHLKNELPFDPETVREKSPADRLKSYLTVSYDTLEPTIPTWKLASHVEAVPDSVELLPSLVNHLSIIQCYNGTDLSPGKEQSMAVNDLLRGSGDAASPPTQSVHPKTGIETFEQAWVGTGIPVGASKAIPEAFQNRLNREGTASGQIDLGIVCNEPEMGAEQGAADDLYGTRDGLSFNITFHENLSTDELATVLQEDLDLFHFIGHVNENGIQCSDGYLDVAALDSVAIDSFFLNACRSYEQGKALIQQGAIAGVVTLSDIINIGALRIGKAMARLLNNGFPLRPALEIAKERSIVGPQYLVVGDGSFDIAHAKGLTPAAYTITPDDTTAQLSITTYPTSMNGLGATFTPHHEAADHRYLVGSQIMDFELDHQTLLDYLHIESTPTKLNGEFYWSDEITKSDLQD